jgi:hypothetical protein
VRRVRAAGIWRHRYLTVNASSDKAICHINSQLLHTTRDRHLPGYRSRTHPLLEYPAEVVQSKRLPGCRIKAVCLYVCALWHSIGELPVTRPPTLQALHIQINDRRDVQSQELGYKQSANNGEAQRLPRISALAITQCDG